RHRISQRPINHFEIGMAKSGGAHAHQHVRWRERRSRDCLDLQRTARLLQHGRAVVEGHGSAEAISYLAFVTSPFFTPASGKIHIAATMNAAVMMTNIESSGRIGEPLPKASTAATISARGETAALTSVGTAIALCLSVGADGNRRRLVGTTRGAAQVPLHEPRIVAVEQVADHAAVEIRGPEQPVGDG